jgi:hypothetical protein
MNRHKRSVVDSISSGGAVPEDEGVRVGHESNSSVGYVSKENADGHVDKVSRSRMMLRYVFVNRITTSSSMVSRARAE